MSVNPLWTLQHLRFRTGPDVAAADTDRVENRDPGEVAFSKGLTKEARLENAPLDSRGSFERFSCAGSGASVCPAC
jgi:hypothetical protein